MRRKRPWRCQLGWHDWSALWTPWRGGTVVSRPSYEHHPLSFDELHCPRCGAGLGLRVRVDAPTG